MLKRGSGILLHISSVPSAYGIGDFGPSSFQFVDFLRKARQTYWQVLPLNLTDMIYGNSPYSSPSAFALNTLFISPELLLKDGWLESKDLLPAPKFPQDRVDYAAVTKYKNKLFSRAYARAQGDIEKNKDYQKFCSANVFWLEDYATFIVLKEHFNGQGWHQWPEEVQGRDTKTLKALREQLREKIAQVKFLQFICFRQWHALRSYCHEKGVQFFGDIPIYVNDDSVDVWAHPQIFKLDEDCRPRFVAGVPPDYFSETGQRWGNPLYDWEALKHNGYEWWKKRIQHNFDLFDLMRIDHFRGFIGYWQIPREEETAVNGQWIPGPGDDFFKALQKSFPKLPIIAEDLGVITPDVTETMKRFGFPGMKVLQFAFGGDIKTHPYIPENYSKDCVAYTGTHDNNTINGWLQNDATENEKKTLLSYLGKKKAGKDIHWDFIQLAIKSVADIAIVPMQDILGLGNEARMNMPGTSNGNWEWRLQKKAVNSRVIEKLSCLTKASGRG